MTNVTDPVADDWYLTFFDDLPTAFWRAVVTPEMTAGEVGWLHRTFAGADGPLLDIPCGDGRHARGLADLGHRIVGIDISDHQLAVARSLSTGTTIEWLRQDMAALALQPGHFAGAYCFGNSFGYFTKKGMSAFLASVTEALTPRAHFAIDTAMIAETLLPKLRPTFEGEVGGIQYSARRTYDPATSYLSVRYEFTRHGHTVERMSRHAVYAVSQLTALLECHGLEIERMDANVEGAPFTTESSRMLVIARRR
jgi:SAM-dependent methyltransferase